MTQPASTSHGDAELVRKALAYITRRVGDKTQLLVFTHRDEPEAGLQIPAGTVEAGELPEDAVFREVEEETGLSRSSLRLVKLVAVYDWFNYEKGEINRRHVYHLESLAPTAEHWDWYETDGGKKPLSEAHCFQYSWQELGGRIVLAANQGDWLHTLET